MLCCSIELEALVVVGSVKCCFVRGCVDLMGADVEGGLDDDDDDDDDADVG